MFRSGPPAPSNPRLREQIERFAQYIAVHGPQAEEVERQRHYSNPQFEFLFNGEGSSYYQYRLAMEITNLKNIAQQPAPTPLSEIRVPAPNPAETTSKAPDSEIDPLEAQLKYLKNQILESERNLKAHHDAMQETKGSQVNKLYQKRETERLYGLFNRVGVDYEPFVALIDHLSDSASKDAIAKCKHWIQNNCNTDQEREIVLSYLLHRCRHDESDGNLRLHILYLINDWAYHCQRQRLDNIRQMLSRYVPKMYAHASQVASLSSKLNKLIDVWERGKYFDENCYKQLLIPANVLETDNATIAGEKSKMSEEVEKELKQTYLNYQKQHGDFEKHNLAQIQSLKHQISKIQEMRVERTRLQNVTFEERLTPKAPYYELPAGMMVPLIKPESVTFEPVDPSQLRLPAPNLLTDHVKNEVERFYSLLHGPVDRFDSNGWEHKGLSEFNAVKTFHKRKLVERLQAEGKTLEDAIINRLIEPLEQDRFSDQPEKKQHIHRSYSSSSSSSSLSSDDRSRSPERKPMIRSRSTSPDERPTFGGAAKSGGNIGFIRPSSNGETGPFKIPGLPPEHEGGKGARLLLGREKQ